MCVYIYLWRRDVEKERLNIDVNIDDCFNIHF